MKALKNTGRKGCPYPAGDPGRTCPPHTSCSMAKVCRERGAAYTQGRNAWFADVALAANPYQGAKGQAWRLGWEVACGSRVP